MRLWADVFDSSTGKRLEGPVSLRRAQVSRVLDGAGKVEIEAQLLDTRARTLFQNQRRVAIYVESNGIIRRVGDGYVTNRTRASTPSGLPLSISGSDLLDELKRKSTLPGRVLNSSLQSGCDLLAGLAGWSVNFSGSNAATLSLQFDGDSVLDALIKTVNSVGAHLRVGVDTRTIDVGSFGETTAAVATNLRVNAAEINNNATLLLIDTIQISDRSDEVVNWLIPFGGSEGADRVTLQYAARPGIFTMTGPDGSTLHGITADDSITTYGQFEKVRVFNEVRRLTPDSAGQIAASNNLYDFARAWLDRQSQIITTYKLTCKKPDVTVRPGDKVRVFYSGLVKNQLGEDDAFMEIDEAFYVIRASESIDESATLELDVSSVDRLPDSVDRTVAQSIRDGRQEQLRRVLST